MTGDISKHYYTAYDIIELISKIGGLSKIIWLWFGYLANPINARVMKAKLIRSLYFILKP